MNILMIGTGYVGLVTGTCLAKIGHTVTCLDIDPNKITSLQQGVIPFYEPGLAELLSQTISSQNLLFTTDYETSVKQADVIFLAVPTPSSEDGSCDLSFFLKAAQSIASHILKPVTIVNKSTVPTGTAHQLHKEIQAILLKRNIDIDIEVVSNPEFLKEGSAVKDFLTPDRIIIGVDTEKARTLMEEMYRPLTQKGSKILFMDTLSSEMTKYAANAMLATRISFMNEIANICEKLGANIEQVKKGMGSDPRIGPLFLNAGIGYGGSCFPKDVKALVAIAKSVQSSASILEAVDTTNQRQKKILIEKIQAYFQSHQGIKGKIIALWGLAFKPNTDDMREAPSLDIIAALKNEGALLRVFDPFAMENAKKWILCHEGITWCSSEYDACQGADALALLTEWDLFTKIEPQHALTLMKGKAFFDGRNVFDPQLMTKVGFNYFGIGMQNAIPLNDR
ncbi:MAG: UDP-glucose/GDP-mannose dehydrogenase family protein [Chlamydiae bacterium]|nr:UDP-glucose/GDP-mannose dehydrogenase family protein [Chlamydiota bacterium]